MKLVTFVVSAPTGRAVRLGALLDGQDGPVVDLTAAYAAYLAIETDEPTPREIAAVRTPPDMIGWLRGAHKSLEAAGQALAFARRRLAADSRPLGLDDAQLVYTPDEIKLLAPLPRPNTLRDFSIYEEHMSVAHGTQQRPPAWYRWPPYYKGNPESVIAPGDPIPYPYFTRKLDLEPEIGIVVGRAGRNLTFEEAKEHIAGYTIFMDCSARDGHERDQYGPATRKDWCNVLGPCLVTPDEIDVMNLRVRVIVDGEVWFDGNSGHRANFRPEHLVAYASDSQTLMPGDVLGTGTVGLGCSMDTGRWPRVGQTITIEIEGIGSLTHPIIAGEEVVSYIGKGMDGQAPVPPGVVPSAG